MSAYLSDDGGDDPLFLRHLQHSAHSGHVARNLVVQLSTFLRQSFFVFMHPLQRGKQLLELVTALLQSMRAGQLVKRLRFTTTRTGCVWWWFIIIIIYYKNRTRSTNMTSHIKTYKWSQ